jgi:hypothetical protein
MKGLVDELARRVRPAEAGRIISLSPARVKQLADAGVLDTIRMPDGTRLISRQSLEKFLEQRDAAASRRG